MKTLKNIFWYDYLDMLSGWGIILIGLIIAVVAIIGVNYLQGVACLKSYQSYNPQYSFLAGCRIDYVGKLTPVGMIKNINLE
jgi:hypothetical protein